MDNFACLENLNIKHTRARAGTAYAAENGFFFSSTETQQHKQNRHAGADMKYAELRMGFPSSSSGVPIH